MSTTTLLRRIGRQTIKNEGHMITQRPTARLPRRIAQGTGFPRHASISTNPVAAQYQIPKRVVHIGIPFLAAIYAVLHFTDPSLAPQPPRKLTDDDQGSCKKIHASDLNKYIRAHPDEMSDEHTVGWNTMFKNFKEHRKNESEPTRIEEENARQLAQYARLEDNKGRSTKVKGTMATEGGNRNISHRPELTDETDGVRAKFSASIAARMAEAKRRFTRATKGSALFG